MSLPAGIARQIGIEGGRVTFARFMELALTHPTDGYYTRAGQILGPRGHFSTAPQLSPAFNQAVGRLVTELIDAARGEGLGTGSIDGGSVERGAIPQEVTLVELGAGEADLAKALLDGWETTRPELWELLSYRIVEVGRRLRERQRDELARLTGAGWKIAWTETLGEALRAAGKEAATGRPRTERSRPGAVVVVSNEFFDALPVHLVDVRGANPVEAWVEIGEDAQPAETWGGLSNEAGGELQALFGTADAAPLRPLSRDGIIELRPGVAGLLRKLAGDPADDSKGDPATVVGPRDVCLLTIDYGDWFAAPGREPRRSRPAPLYGRTLRGYYRHQTVNDPYQRVGSQDLTADVDFRALALHGEEAGFEPVLFTSVADLLWADGGAVTLEELRAEAASPTDGALAADRQATVLEALLDREGLGAAFKVLLQVRE